MKFNVASPLCGTQKQFEVEDEQKLAHLNDKRVAQTFEGDLLGDQFKGYVFKITGGCDKQGFPMMQGILTNSRVKVLLNPGSVGYQNWRAGKKGTRRRKSVRGCIVGQDISVLNVIIIQEGPEKLEGLTDVTVPRRYGPKRADKIRKLFNLEKADDVRKFVIRHTVKAKEGKKARTKAPRIQRLVTPVKLSRRRRKVSLRKQQRVKSREERETYNKMRLRRAELRKRRARSKTLKTMKYQRTKELMLIAHTKGLERLAAAKEAQERAAKEEASKGKKTKGAAKAPAKAAAKAPAKAAAKAPAKAAAKPAAKAAAKPAAKAAAKPAAKAPAKASSKGKAPLPKKGKK
eukprot:NODE_982_length_1191_cov_1036.570053_g746_i0.p1 GENE.NODE_982_length_1191_cov_1036.570053_g746_i0~~NODE_982_length_1191_cov_1036.570053_g746_i0.p1  ORF type:complete len:346 (-),score=99.39 NODE_982_length_1191_cov_1036.570053_g746_i0:86-1123(-)